MRLGILGGTFDPIHLGHLRAAEEVSEHLELEKVYLVPSASPPHKTQVRLTPFHHRLAMTRLAAEDSPMLEAMDLEGRRPGLSYSIVTLREFHELFGPDTELFFILGVDAFLEIKTWKEYRSLFDYAHFVVLRRPGYGPDELQALIMDLGLKRETGSRPGIPEIYVAPSGRHLILMSTTLMDISSTRIREMAAEGKSINFLVPGRIRDYIMEKGLYTSRGIPA